ncbi:unnamed protein product (macronuclear) [Paramecium tetraurelia]|uniref:Uncharacterized protein n=1 Tax=Paramecium tetraurelia TaxID=5888 RepID=A0D7L4_PARTE|nr:uncharacterized protein GSPATT00013998001 [Paramecium tetraurelia]CAK79031.1 unnamed protein product [Paramecium tetraurelia]|eukprot:XP_001446428.1 hypothetical protein (macronuclear) [Paramecium tetraurelia strain d4-2]
MSKIVKQRVSMHDESTSLSNYSKSVNKRSNYLYPCNQLGKQNLKHNSTKQLICIVSVPKQLKERVYIKSEVELKLAINYIPEHCLGNLKETPCTYNYRVTRTDQLDDVYFYTLELLDQPNYSIDQIVNLLLKQEDQYAQLAVELVHQRFNILNEYTQHYYISNEELLEVEQLAQGYPYHCIIQKVNKDNSSLSQRIVNEQFYALMGVTREMVSHHLHETKTLPSIFDVGTSLKLWCDVTLSSLSGVSHFDQYINTYEGAQYKCRIEQKQMFKRTQVNPNQIVFIEFRIFKLEEPLKSQLLNPQRLYQNQIDYFNRKNTEQEYQQFLNSMNYKQSLHYNNSQPCGYKQLAWI